MEGGPRSGRGWVRARQAGVAVVADPVPPDEAVGGGVLRSQGLADPKGRVAGGADYRAGGVGPQAGAAQGVVVAAEKHKVVSVPHVRSDAVQVRPDSVPNYQCSPAI